MKSKKKLLNRWVEQITFFNHKLYCKIKYIKIKDKNISIITNNCLAGCLYKDINTKFLSPTINMYFDNNDYIEFITNLKYYIKETVYEYKNNNFHFPIGYYNKKDKSGIIKLYFMHYSTFDQAQETWYQRCKRINFNKIIYIFEFNSIGIDNNTILQYYKKFKKQNFKKSLFISGLKYKNKIYRYIDIYDDEYYPGKSISVKSGFFNKLFMKKYYDDVIDANCFI